MSSLIWRTKREVSSFVGWILFFQPTTTSFEVRRAVQAGQRERLLRAGPLAINENGRNSIVDLPFCEALGFSEAPFQATFAPDYCEPASNGGQLKLEGVYALRRRSASKPRAGFHRGETMKGRGMVRQIVIELETPGDSRTMFRLRVDDNLIAEDLTAVQAHILVGEILERIALPKQIE